jgi:hypothetical protein
MRFPEPVRHADISEDEDLRHPGGSRLNELWLDTGEGAPGKRRRNQQHSDRSVHGSPPVRSDGLPHLT